MEKIINQLEPIKNVLYITTFNQKLFNATGKNMLQSFAKSKTEGDLSIGMEGDLYNKVTNALRDFRGFCYLHDLSQNQFMKDWITQNRDIIPPEYGGICIDYDKKNRPNWCNNFNRQTARWFRKIATLHAFTEKRTIVAGLDKFDTVILCDCDIVFMQNITLELLNNICGNFEFCYHMGENRRRRDTGVEMGFTIFRKTNNQFRVIDLLINEYKSGHFRQHRRWDDGYVVRKILEQYQINGLDLVRPHIEQYGAHVIIHGPFKDYVSHFKGCHRRMGLIKLNSK